MRIHANISQVNKRPIQCAHRGVVARKGGREGKEGGRKGGHRVSMKHRSSLRWPS